jgi:hypothetical protein
LSVLVARYVASDGLWNGSSTLVDAGWLVVVATVVVTVDVEVDVEVTVVVVVPPTIVVDDRGCWEP